MKRWLLALLLMGIAPVWSQERKFGDKPDLNFFAEFVQPTFRDVCSTCHSQNGNAAFGRFPMQQSFGSPYTDEQTQKNFEEAVRRIRPKDPNGSLLLNKPLAKVTHGGGQQVREGGKDQKNFIDWINGAIGTKASGGAGGPFDLAFFESRVAAILDKKCAIKACHGGTTGAGAAFHLEPSANGRFAPEVIKANFTEVTKRAKPKDLNASLVLLKPTGDRTHEGGTVLQKASQDFGILVEFVNGASLSGGGLDRAFFDQFVNPILGRTCGVSACHGGSDGIGARFHLHAPNEVGKFSQKQLDDNFMAVTNPALPRAKPSDPQSLVLLKPTGGAPHVGGIKLPKTSKEYQTVLAWVNGARARPNRPPIVAQGGVGGVLEQRLGAPVPLDLSGSSDTENDTLSFEYKLMMAPRGARAEVRGTGARAALTTDRPGAYVISVTASDGKPGGESDPYKVTVIVTGATTEEAAAVGPRTIPAATTEVPGGRRELFVRRAYFEVLGRGPTIEEFALAVGQPRDQLVAGLFNRPEYYRHWLEEQFQLLGLTGSHRFSADLVQGATLGLFNRDYGQLPTLYTLFTSKQYVDRNFGAVNPRDFFMTLFQQLVGRDPTDTELRNVGPQLVQHVMATPEFYVRYAHRSYRRLVGADASNELAVKLAERLSRFPAAAQAIEQEIVLSADYLNSLTRPKPKTSVMLAESLVRDLLGRAPNESEFDAAQTALGASQDQGAVALLIGRALLGSADANLPTKANLGDRAKWVRDTFVRLLRREPTAKEVGAFVEAMNEAVVTPRLIIEALISSPEYLIY